MCLDIAYLLKTEDLLLKHYSKLIFKYGNSAVGLKFILKSMFGWLLWVYELCRGIHIFLAKHTNPDMEHFPNAHLFFGY